MIRLRKGERKQEHQGRQKEAVAVQEAIAQQGNLMCDICIYIYTYIYMYIIYIYVSVYV
jgi:hypothetical protein